MEKVEYSVVSGDVIISGRYVKHKFADPVQVRRGGNGVTRVGNSATNVHCRHAGWSQWEREYQESLSWVTSAAALQSQLFCAASDDCL